MVYTFNDLERMYASNTYPDKWGKDSEDIHIKISDILNAACSPCMFRRKLNGINAVLAKYGDSLNSAHTLPKGSSENTVKNAAESIVTGKITIDNREECRDCVKKHVAQAYILQGEFYSGYKEYCSLIVAHLDEALSECPKDDVILYGYLYNLRSKASLHIPDISMDVILDILEEKTDENTEKVLIEQPFIENSRILYEFSRISPEIQEKLIKIIEKAVFYQKSEKLRENSFSWEGYMAWASEICAMYSPTLSIWLRKKRLAGIRLENAKNGEQEKQSLDDILQVIKNR